MKPMALPGLHQTYRALITDAWDAGFRAGVLVGGLVAMAAAAIAFLLRG